MYPTFSRNHWADIERYEDDVIQGVRPACQWERLAVQRQINDLKKSANDDYPYYFDFDKALEPIYFAECFPHVKGKWASGRSLRDKLIVLSPWQKWIIANCFGWRRKDNGFRRFSFIYICVPRKNGKSVLAAVMCLFMLAKDGECGAEVYCGATNQKQAWEVFRPAKKMAAMQPSFRKKFNVSIAAQKISLPDDSRMEALIGKPGDGASPSFWVADEYHEHEDDSFVDTMQTGQGAREQGLGMVITTAGDNHDGPCFATEAELKETLLAACSNSSSARDDTTFGVVYTIDKDVDWKSPEALEMANPNIGISVGRDYLIERQKKASQSSRKQNSFKNKHLDIWVSARDSWLNMEYWAKAKCDLTLDDFVGESCGIGGDLSESIDLTAFVKCFERVIDGKKHYFFFGRYYTTSLQVKEKENYSAWVHDGFLTECDGAMIDYEDVKEDVKSDSETFSIGKCFFDPKGAAVISQQIDNDLGIEAVRFEQSYTNFSPVMKDFEALLIDGRIHHDGNPCLAWMMGNIIAKTTMDGKDIRPVKLTKNKKIDGGVALLMSFANVYVPDDETSLDEHIKQKGLRTL